MSELTLAEREMLAGAWQDETGSTMWAALQNAAARIATARETRLRNRMIDAFVDEFEHDRIEPGGFDRLLRVAKADLEGPEAAQDGPGASASVEVDSGATGDVAGAQIGGYCAADETTQCGLADECLPFHCREDHP